MSKTPRLDRRRCPSLAGGFIGVTIGVMGTVSMSLAAEDLALHISASTVLRAAGSATGVGLIFGIGPVVRSSSQWRPSVTNRLNRAIGFHCGQHRSS